MDKVRLALVLITIAITVGPILGIVLVYRDNLLGLVVPPEINQVTNNLENNSQTSTQPGESGGGILAEQPGPSDMQYDQASRTFTVKTKIKNPLPIDATLNSMSGTLVCDEHGFPLGTISLKDPVKMKAGETVTAIITGTYTDDAVNHFTTQHAGQQSIAASITDTTINVGGMIVQVPDRISLGDIPITGS
jgi:hypothetical protein